MNFPVFDLHCDTSFELLRKNLSGTNSLRKNDLHIDLERAGRLPGYAQCFACFTTPEVQKWLGKSPVEIFERELATILYQIECNQDKIALAYTPDAIEENLKKGIQSAVLTIEGPAGFDFDVELLPMLYQVGYRMTTLCWNESNPLTGSHVTGEGLSALGKQYVAVAQKCGMIVDVSHISEKAFWEVIEIAKKPIVASHSNSAAICPHSRNLTDQMFAAICKTDGMVGINLYREFLGGTTDLDTVCDHILHFMESDPKAEHIGLGGDLDGCDALAEGFDGVQGYERLAERLLMRGVGEDLVMNIFWNNALGVFEKCCI
jgi:membrane dipeptidase